MSALPDYVTYAFRAIRVISTEEWLQEDIEAFQERWGGVDLLTFARVREPGAGRRSDGGRLCHRVHVLGVGQGPPAATGLFPLAEVLHNAYT